MSQFKQRFIFIAITAAMLAGCTNPPVARNQMPTSAALPAAPEAASGFTDKVGVAAKKFMIATANPLATEAGYQVLKAGGAAIDAAIAAQMVLTLVEPQSSGIGVVDS